MGVGAGLGAVAQGKDFGEAWRHQTDASRQTLARSREFRPWATMGGSLAGGIAFGGALGGLARATQLGRGIASAASAMTPMQRLYAAAGSGLGFGGLYGAGSGGDMDTGLNNRALNAAIGAGIGGITAGALQGIGMAGGHILRGLQQSSSPEAAAAKQIADAMRRTGMTPQSYSDELTRLRALDPRSGATVMDAFGDAGSGVTLGAASRQSTERTAMRNSFNERNASSFQIIDDAISRLTDGRTASGTIDEAIRAQREIASPLYEKALSPGIVDADVYRNRIKPLIENNPRLFNVALEKADALVRSETGGDLSKVNLARQLDYIKKGADEAYRGLKREPGVGGLGPDEGRIYAVALDKFRHALDDAIPGYGEARSAFEGEARVRAAAELGADVMRGAPGRNELVLGDITRKMGRMSDSEQQAFFNGVVGALRGALKAGDDMLGRRDAVKAIRKNRAADDLLRHLFRNKPEALDDLMAVLEAQARLFQNTVDAGIGVNSHTAPMQSAAQTVFSGSPNGVMGRVWGGLSREAKDRFDEDTADAILRLMRTSVHDPAASDIVGAANRNAFLAKVMKAHEQQRLFRQRHGLQAAIGGATAAVGVRPQDAF